MAQPDGFLVLARKLFASDLWNKPEPFDSRSAFVDLLRRASYSARAIRTHGRELQLMPGELLVNSRQLAARWGWSPSKVQRFLRELKQRGTLSSRPAWDTQATTRVPPRVYAFPNWDTHQRPWDMTQERDAGNTPVPVDDTPNPRRRNVTQEENPPNGGDAGTRRRKSSTPTGILSQPVTQERDAGFPKSDAGNTPVPVDDSPIGDAGREYKSFKNTTNYPISLLYSGNDFDAVQELAALADRIGWQNGANPHRGLNVKLLVKLVAGGTDPATLAHIIRGTRLLVDAGRVPWVQPGEPFSLAAIWGDQRHIQDRALSSVALETSSLLDPHDSPEY